MKKEKITVYIKEPGKRIYAKEIPNELRELQKIVCGYIETYPISTDLVLICNEEGKIFELPYNFTFGSETFVGTCIIAGKKEDEFASVPVSKETVEKLFFGFRKKPAVEPVKKGIR